MKLTVKEFNTNPIALHGNGTGKATEVYNKIGNHQFSKQVEKINGNKYTFISWKGGNIAGRNTVLEASGAQYGFKVLNLPWADMSGFWKSTQQKITETLKAIKTGLVQTEYVFWLDNTDVFFIDSPDVFFEKYKSVYGQYDFVWNAEKNNFPTTSHAKWANSKQGTVPDIDSKLEQVIQYDETFATPFKYMNSGAGFGKTASLLQQLELANSLIGNSRLTDQALLRIAQFEMKDSVMVDRECNLFLCCWGLDSNEVTITY